MSDQETYLISREPKPIIYAEILPSVTLELPKKPHWWNRIWHFIFFGVIWKDINNE